MDKRMQFAESLCDLGEWDWPMQKNEAMMYLVGVLESRHAINLKTGMILVQMQSDFPKLMQKVFGGSLYWRVQGKTRSRVYKAQGKLAREIMTLILPYLVFGRTQVERFLKDDVGRRSPRSLR